MNILVFNCGSSSQSAKLYQQNTADSCEVLATLKARQVDTPTSAKPCIDWKLSNGQTGTLDRESLTHRQAAQEILAILQHNHLHIDAVGHRFVHGGDLFQHSTQINPLTLAQLHSCEPLAPIHNPNSIRVIETCLEELPDIPQFAVFDTAFHALLPDADKQYAIPRGLAEKFGYHKYGFHGLSCQYVSQKTAQLLNKPLEQVKLIICHLGTGGSSVTAFAEGHSVATSMGYSPLAGLVMSTRCGDLDPEILLDLQRKRFSAEEISDQLNHHSGLIGLSGYSSNLNEIIEKAENGDAACQTAYDVYANRLMNYIGAYQWQLNGADAIIFTDDLGVKCWKLRQRVCGNAQNLGVILNVEANQNADTDHPAWVQAETSSTKVLVIPTDEEWVILQEVTALLK